ncbi:prepilin-type N-terminal cleavage/methylation domain-containing protein [Ureibacillus sp. MALMAid1270]|uniref:prepilin-type N-terminal cleavage/methylation domain-containing protein n=1 Tax=Ureibacillus sp. MALMAid1270 TaxID=3411629 RepID=UPI003BA61545
MLSLLSMSKFRYLNNKGLTLIELLAVIVILSIIILLAIPSISAIMDKMNAEVCNYNRMELEKSYELHLTVESLEHQEILFMEHLFKFHTSICPVNGVITFKDGHVLCSVHSDQELDEDQMKRCLIYK